LLCRLTGAPLLWCVFIITKTFRAHKGFLQVKIDPSELVSQQQAAKMRGVSFQAIQYLIKQGRFTVVEIGERKYLFRKEVEAFEPSPPGRPRKDSAINQSRQGSKTAKRGSPAKTKSAKKKRAS
jgi:hypothetical protein